MHSNRPVSRAFDTSQLLINGARAPELTRLREAGSAAPRIVDRSAALTYRDELAVIRADVEASHTIYMTKILPQLESYTVRTNSRSGHQHEVKVGHAETPKRRSDGRGRKQTNVSHLERVRAAAANPNSVWTRAMQFFAPLPSDSDINVLFSRLDRLPTYDHVIAERPHWSTRFESAASRAGGRAHRPPGPQRTSSEIADIWTRTRLKFPVEHVQKMNRSVLHFLLSALVSAERQPPLEKTEGRPFVRRHGLLPTIKGNDYLGLGFDRRLDLELDSLDLGQNKADGAMVVPFQDEIDTARTLLEAKLVPRLQHAYNELRVLLPRAKAREIRRAEGERLAEISLAELQAKKKSRK